MAELTKMGNRQPMEKIKPTDKMVMMLSLYDGTKPATSNANGLFFFLCWMLFALFAGFLASFVVRSLRLFWGMVVRGFARRNLC